MKCAWTSRVAVVAVIAFLSLLVGCAASSPSSRSGPAVPPPSVSPGPPVLKTAGGLAQVGREAAAFLRRQYPDYASGRMAVGWDPRLPFINEVGAALAARWPRALPLSEIGVAASSHEQAFNQLDPTTFSGLIWLRPDILPGPELAGVTVTLQSTGPYSPKEVTLECTPPFAFGQAHHEEAATHEMTQWLELPSAPLALGWETPSGYLWIATAKTLERFDPAMKSDVQKWAIPPPQDRFSAGPAVLHEVDDGGVHKMGWFDLGYAEGRSYAEGSSGAFQPGDDLQAFPLSQKLQRFLSAPFDLLAGEFVLTDFRHEELGRFQDMTRFQGPRGSLFAFLRRDGSIGVVQGTDLSVVNGPNLRSASAVTSYGNYLLVASADPPYHVKAFVMTSGFVWESRWESGDLPGPATALCTGTADGRPALYIGEKSKAGGLVYRTDLPAQASADSPADGTTP